MALLTLIEMETPQAKKIIQFESQTPTSNKWSVEGFHPTLFTVFKLYPKFNKVL
jgi:hypothetical protein